MRLSTRLVSSALMIALSLSQMGGCGKSTNGSSGSSDGTAVAPWTSAFRLAYPEQDAQNQPTTITFAWTLRDGATGYILQVSKTEAFSDFVLNQSAITGTAFTLTTPLLQATRYYWRVYAVYQLQNVLADGSPRSFVTAGTPPASTVPGAFSPLQPADGASYVPVRPEFTWNPASGAETYTLQVATDLNFTQLHLNIKGITSTTYVATPQFPSLTGFVWRVYAVNSAGQTLSTGAPWYFSTEMWDYLYSPGPAEIRSPAQGATGVSRNPKFEWSSADSAYSYTLAVARDPAFADIIVLKRDLTRDQTSHQWQNLNLEPNKTYYWRVIAYNPYGSRAGKGSPWAFTTGQ